MTHTNGDVNRLGTACEDNATRVERIAWFASKFSSASPSTAANVKRDFRIPEPFMNGGDRSRPLPSSTGMYRSYHQEYQEKHLCGAAVNAMREKEW